MNIRKAAAVGLMTMTALAVPSAASAVTLYQGADFAYNSGNTGLTVCDRENDNHSVYSDFTGTAYSGRQFAPGYNQCRGATIYYLRSFNVCEQINYFPDACSHRAYL